MKVKKYSLAALATALLALSTSPALALDISSACPRGACSEAELNAPVPGTEELADERPLLLDAYRAYEPPAFDASWGLRYKLYAKAVDYYRSQQGRISNSRYLTIIDMSMHSSQKRYFLFDLATGKVERHNVSHGEGSDPNRDGYATKFSNTPDSHMTSLGFYLTLGTYQGGNGYSMRLRGLQSTNDNAERRYVVVHPAKYVSNSQNKAGLSWGCPALDPKISKSVINKIKGGSLFLIED
jgi:hypothetical protein